LAPAKVHHSTQQNRDDLHLICGLGVGPMPDASHLRDLAARMLALALTAKDQRLLEWLSVRAGEYLDQAAALEAAHHGEKDE
jgi:hypothetical protein